ncbi:MAG: fibronectin type III domain-containing protein [Nitrospiraceae bacterium]|nr:MAG: fibronectin type III domain-containing protein [Nitrospiraceae bacterium]
MRTAVYFICLSLTAYCLLLASCGRRGDPVLVEPRDERAAGTEKGLEGPGDSLTEQKKSVQEIIRMSAPEAPTRLLGLYTLKDIVLTWDEVAEQNITYRIYRSAGDSFTLAGETVTPAFTDKNVEPDKKYLYRVTAVGATEGPPSEEIMIITEIH